MVAGMYSYFLFICCKDYHHNLLATYIIINMDNISVNLFEAKFNTGFLFKSSGFYIYSNSIV